jgi:pimeloyl-ACP methyl ester carboxylesterase
VHVETTGSGPRVVLVHGSVAGPSTWDPTRPLADRNTLVLVTRPGFADDEPIERVDFERDAELLGELLRPGDHLVGHSYGGVVSLLAAAQRPILASLAVGEPPAFGVASDNRAVREFMRAYDEIVASAPLSPREYLKSFLPLVGTRTPIGERLSPVLEQGTRAAMAERPPNEAVIPLDELAEAPFPKLVISGGHNAALDAVCDVLVERLPAERAVVPGAGHSLPRAPGYNEALVGFIERAG